jgi:pre-mRNA processing factor 4 (PRP4) like
MADGGSPEEVDEVMVEADAPAASASPPPHDAGASVAAGQAAGNVHLAAGDAETMEHAAASREAADRQARLIAQVEERRRLRATVVPTAVDEVKQLLRQLEQPITLFGEREVGTQFCVQLPAM